MANDSHLRWGGFGAALFFFMCFVLSLLVTIARANHHAGVVVCELINENYYRREEPGVASFIERCRAQAEASPYTLSRSLEIQRINRSLDELKTSHLSVFVPSQNQQMWQNEAFESGARARRIEGEIVLFKILKGSAADKAGLQPGDIVVRIEGRNVASTDEVISMSGDVVLERDGKELTAHLKPAEITEDLGPELKSASSLFFARSGEDLDLAHVGYLRLGSFLPQYFDGDRWPSVAKNLVKYQRLVIDLRGNAGGSFPAMMKAISPFFCGEGPIGALRMSSTEEFDAAKGPALLDDLSSESQLAQFESAPLVRLVPYPSSVCFRGPVTVLIDSDTLSTGEIFAQSFHARAHSRVWGWPSGGQVVVARWFDLHELGPEDYSISIPIAGFITPAGLELEGMGVRPDRELQYDLKAALRGEDSWIRDAAVSF